MPSLEGTLHAMQLAGHPELQQRPSMQLPLLQSLGPMHGAPFGLGPQLALVQTFGALHSLPPDAQVE